MSPSTPIPHAPDAPTEPLKPELIVVHFVAVLDTRAGWRVTVRIQDGWQGATLENWSRGRADVTSVQTKAPDDLQVALTNALEYLATF